jgi:sugar phosphate isomerase/epimerase
VRVGLGSYAFRWAVGTAEWCPAAPLDASALVDVAAALGAEVLQICDNAPLDALSRRALRALAGRAAAAGVALQLGVRSVDLAALRDSLAVAAQIEARVMRVVLDGGADCDALLQALLPDLRAAGVTLAVENHFALAPVDLARLVDGIGDPHVGVCLDPLNSIARLVGVPETVRALAPHAVVIHAKDAVTRRAGTGFAIVGCPLGEGLVDVSGILDAVRAAGRDPDVLVEGWMDRLADEAATLVQEEAWARRGIALLRRLVDGAQA